MKKKMKRINALWGKIFGYSKGDRVCLLKESEFFIFDWRGETVIVNEWIKFPKGCVGIIEDKIRDRYYFICWETSKSKRGYRAAVMEKEFELA